MDIVGQKKNLYTEDVKSFYYVYNTDTKELKSLSDTLLVNND